MLGRTYPPEVLSRVLYATQFTRHLDPHGYIRFNNWRIFGEDGLAGEPVSVWIYEGTLKIEYQTTALSLYSVHLSPDHQITEVTNPRRLETRFRSPQLDLWQVSDTECLVEEIFPCIEIPHESAFRPPRLSSVLHSFHCSH